MLDLQQCVQRHLRCCRSVFQTKKAALLGKNNGQGTACDWLSSSLKLTCAEVHFVYSLLVLSGTEFPFPAINGNSEFHC
jgi:hypothetical protein